MQVSYRNKRDEKIYQTRELLVAEYGSRGADKIIQRISELQAARTPQQLPSNARFHEHSGKRKGLFSLDLIHPRRLIVLPTCSYDYWYEITSVVIFEIYNPHQ